jgi:hypothetical protein
MKASPAAIAHVSRLRSNGFDLSFYTEETKDLGILCIAEKGDALFFVYPDGAIDDKSRQDDEEDFEDSYEAESRAEYAFAIGA